MPIKTNKTWLAIAVLSVVTLVFSTSAVTPALAGIATAFPNASPEFIKQMTSLPAWLIVVFSLLGGFLLKAMSRRLLMIITIVLLMIGGILPGFFGGLVFILVMRAVYGCGLGFAFTLYTTLISDFYDGEKRGKMLGYAGAVGNASGIVYQILGGVLATVFWRYCFYAMFLMIPVLLLTLLKLPNPELKSVGADSVKEKLPLKTYLLVIFNCIFNMFWFSYFTNVALVMADGNIGSPATVLITFAAAGFVAGIVYGRVAKVLKGFMLPIAIACIAISFIIMILTHTTTSYIIASILFGLGFGTYNPEFSVRVFASAPQSANAQASGLYWAFNGLGQLLSPIVLAPVSALFGFSFTGIIAHWNMAAFGLTVIFIISLLIEITKEKPVTVRQ